MRSRCTAALAAVALIVLAPPLYARVDPDLLAGLKARSIGPAAMSGRIAAVAGVPSHPGTLYVGAATGGVWKSVDGGVTWKPLFDDQPVAAIGAVAVHPLNTDAVWVGTGEGNPRNSASVGNGVYRSLDGGRTWTHLGLDKTERIHRIVLHPRNPDIAWVAALGQAWGENPERGIFKTTDGGKTWRRVLYADERSGAADLVIDPTNPDKLFAALWDYRRQPWFFRSGGPGSGLYVSHDGGETWDRQTPEDGLPAGNLGRIGLAVAPSDPRVVYALVEADKSALLRSEDGGRSWKAVNTAPDVSDRPFYYADLRVDPTDPNRVYRLASTVDLSTDGGRTFATLVGFSSVHPDHHALWIDPADPDHIVEGNDGGLYISRDRGATWRFVANLPVGQFYHVRLDDQTPYNVYGGLQDNGSWKGPSAVWEDGAIRNHHWQELLFGDGFDTAPDPRDPEQGYAMSQEGYLTRWNLRTGERRDIRPSGRDGKLRFNWNAALALDPFEPDTIYYGSQLVHKSTDRGETWTQISEDLTTNKPEWQRQAESGGLTPDVTGAENFTTIIAIAPSPKQRGVLWVGTDDGRLHVTRDGGATWTSVEKNVRGVPANTWIPHVTPSPHDAATAFVVFDDHRRSNWTPYVYRTTDYGRTWTSLATADLRGYALIVAQDPVDPNLLFLGTEFGLWVSLDAGKSWLPFRHGVPTVSVMDLAIHPREHDLVIATHGRGLYVIDDLRPLRQLSEKILGEPLHLFEATPAIQHTASRSAGGHFSGDIEFQGENRPYGALLTYALDQPGLPHPIDEKERRRKEEERAAERPEIRKTRPEPTPAKPEEGAHPQETAEESATARQAAKEEPSKTGAETPEKPETKGVPDKPTEVEIRIADASGATIRTLKVPAKQGVNRAVWDLRRDAFKNPPREQPDFFGGGGGPEVLPGTYTVTVKLGGHEAKGTVQVLPDPRVEISDADRRASYELLMAAGRLQETVAEAVERLQRVRGDVGTVLARLDRQAKDRAKAGEVPEAEKKAGEELAAQGQRLQEKLNAVEKKLWQPPGTRGIPAPDDALSAIQITGFTVGGTYQAPTRAQRDDLELGRSRLEAAVTELNGLFAKEVPDFRAKVQETELKLIPAYEPLAVPPAAR